MRTKHVIAASATTALMILSCPLPAVGADVVQDAKVKVFEIFDKESITVNFKKGSAVLDQSEVDDLNALLTATKREAKIDRLIVAAWSDKDYPVEKGKSLGEADQKLATQRADRVKSALIGLGATVVETFSMAEHPTWISEAFNTRDAKVKGEGVVESMDDKVLVEIGQKLRDKGGTGSAVVIVLREGDLTAH